MRHALTHSWRATALAALLAIGLTACGKKDADEAGAGTAAGTPAATTPAAGISVTDVKLGKAVDAGQRITDETDDFKPADMVYASVLTSGASPSTTITAKWTFQDGQTVDSTTQSIAPTGDAVTTFHIMKPGGLPKGKYKVAVTVNGAEARTKEFEVED